MFVGLLLVAGTFTVLTAPAEARGVQLSLYNTGTRYVGQLVPMRGFMNYAGTKHNKTLLLQKFYKGKWYTIERKLNRANGGFRFRGRTYDQPMERYFRVVAKKNGKTLKVSRAVLVRVKKRSDPTPPAPPPNTRPVATEDAATVENNTTTPIPVLANDTDANGDALTITRVGAPDHGLASISSGAVLYTPNAGYPGPTRFDYAISDGKGGTNSALGQVTVTSPAGPTPGSLHGDGQSEGRRSRLHPGSRRDQQRGDRPSSPLPETASPPSRQRAASARRTADAERRWAGPDTDWRRRRTPARPTHEEARLPAAAPT